MLQRHLLRRHLRTALYLLASVTVLATLVRPGAAMADTAPPATDTTTTVAADVLPTVQVNGVVWAQAVVGDTVYATGAFTLARPAGAPAGTSETPRSNLLAYDLTTGALITTWAPTLNGQGLAVAASADGSRIFVGGDFTSVNGVNRYRVAALDATTGALVPGFAPILDARVRTLAVVGTTVYAGGIFGTASGQPRAKLAAFSATNGALLAWNPSANAEVLTMVAPAGGTKLVVGGRFTTLGTQNWYGMGALDLVTGANVPWAATSVIRNAGQNSAIYSLTSDGTQVFGTGYTFGGGGNLEGSFGADATTGALTFVNGCRGDTYAGAPANGVLYTVSHAHDCSAIGGHPQVEPHWTYQRAMALTAGPAKDGRVNAGGKFNGRPSSELLHWLPTLAPGTYTGQKQAAWTVNATSRYVLIGGEFPSVNGVPQQGLARFAVRGAAANTEGPQGYTELTPTLAAAADGKVAVSWTAAWDRDNRRLSYEVLRGATLSTSVVVSTQVLDSNWWTRPKMTFTDTTATPGSTASYRIRVTDPLGNAMTSVTASTTVPGAAPANPAPTASFTSGSSGLDAGFDGRASSDPNGTVTGWAWTFGDGTTGTGSTASHTYAAAGTYTVTLTVTDNGGATGALSRSVTVTAAPPAGGAGTALAADAFDRTLASGFGSAATGGSWVVSSGAGASVADGSGRISLAAGRSATARLSAVSSTGADATATVWLEQAPTGGGAYVAVSPRTTGTNEYRGRLKFLAGGQVQLGVTSVVSGTETAVGPAFTVPGLSYTAGTKLRLRVQAVGTSPTTVQARVWVAGTAEPTGWQVSVSDGTNALQSAGSVGVYAYVSGSASTVPVVTRVDDLTATQL